MNLKRQVIYVVLVFSALPSAYAAPLDAISNAFQMFFSWMQMTPVLFGITFIFLMVMLYGIFAAGLSRINAFRSGEKISRPGKMVALSLSVIATIGMLFVIGNSPGESLRRILSTMGWFATAAFSLLIFGVSYLNFKGEEKTWPLVFLTTGLGMVVFGLLSKNESWFSFGWAFIIIGTIWFLLSGTGNNENNDVPMNMREIPGEEPRTHDRQRDEDPETPSPPDINKHLQELKQLLKKYSESLKTHQKICDEILMANHLHRNNSGSATYPPVSDDQWLKSHKSARSLNLLYSQIIDEFNEFFNISGFANIPPAQKQELMDYLNLWASLRLQLGDYLKQFEKKFNDGEKP